MFDRIHRFIFPIAWNVYSRFARRLGIPDPETPDVAWINTRPRMEKLTEWIWNKFTPSSK